MSNRLIHWVHWEMEKWLLSFRLGGGGLQRKGGFMLRIIRNILFLYSNISQEEMGCEPSQLSGELEMVRADSLTTEGQQDLQFHKFVERQRGDVLELYHFSKVISRSATIVRKVLERSSRIERICKILPANKRLNLLKSYQQVQILKNLNHPNIVQIIEYFSQHNFLYIVLEDIPGKTLQQLYFDEDLRCLENIIDIIRQILLALKFCHQQGYAHKAINPEHIMIVKLDKKKGYLVKLIGFGQAMRIGAKKMENNIIKKDPLFTAPEADNGIFEEKQDVWACGILFLEMISGERKFPQFLQRKEEIIENVVKKQNLTQNYRSTIIDFFAKILAITPQRRCSAQQALTHGIFELTHNKTIRLNVDNMDVMQKLMRFRVETNLKSLFSIYASLNILSVYEKSEHLMEFYNLDKNKDGKIDYDELVEGMQNTFGIDRETAQESVNKIFAQSKKSHENFLEFHEYVTATTFVSKQVYEKSLIKIFGELDTNKDGKISQEQLSRSIEGVNCSTLMKDHKNKWISYEQFRELMLSIFEEQKTLMEQQ